MCGPFPLSESSPCSQSDTLLRYRESEPALTDRRSAETGYHKSRRLIVKRTALLLAWCLLVPTLVWGDEKEAAPQTLPKVHKIAVGGEGGWDYLTVDSPARRLYVSRGNRVVVIDLETEKIVGELPDTPGIHGIAIVSELGKGYTSNGSDSSVTVFDLKTLKALKKIEARGVPDAILYDAHSKRVFTFNHSTDDATAIDTIEDKVVGTITFEAEPEAAVADGQGHIFVNLRSTSEIGEFDAKSLKILNRWPLAPGVRPNGLGFDAKHRRLFSTCGNQKMVVMDANTGKVLADADIGRGSDGCLFDAEKGLAYSSNGEGTITAVRETEPGKFTPVRTIPTQSGARTLTHDPKTHRWYRSAATVASSSAWRRAMASRSAAVAALRSSASFRRASAAARWAAVSFSRRSRSTALDLKICTASAIAPISSRRDCPSISTDRSPPTIPVTKPSGVCGPTPDRWSRPPAFFQGP